MRKFYKPLSVLLALSMCVSMIAPALAKGSDSDYNLKDYDEYRDWGAHENMEPPTELDVDGKIEETLEEKVDQEVIGDTNDAAKDLTDTAAENEQKATEAADKANELADALDQIIDAVTKVPEVDAEAETKDESVTDKDGNPVTNEKDEEVKVLDVQVGEKDDGTQVPTVEVNVEVKTDEDGKPVTEQKAIDKFASEKAEAVEAAKTEAETAATSAQNALTAAQTAVSSRDQAALDMAKDQAARAFADANEAAKTAAENYAVAEKVVTDAQAAYDAAVAKLEAAGYDLGTIEQTLADAKTAVETAQTNLAQAEKARNEAEKQRDYAKVYAAMATALDTKYDPSELPTQAGTEEWLKNPENEQKIQTLLDAMDTLREVSGNKQYGKGENAVDGANLTQEEFGLAYQMIYGSGKNFYDTWYDSYRHYQWDSTLKNRDEAAEKVKELEGKFGIDTAGQEDLLYKVFKYAVDEKAQQALTSKQKEKLEEFANGIAGYWQIEKFLDHTKDGQRPDKDGNVNWTPLGEKSYTVEVIDLDSGEPLDRMVTLKENEDGSKSITVGGKTYTPDSPEWNTYTALIRQQMVNQLRDVNISEIKKAVKTLSDLDVAATNPNRKLLAGYLELLEKELPIRADEQEYVASRDTYVSMVESNSLMQVLLSGANLSVEALKQEIASGSLPEGMTVDDAIGQLEKLAAVELARALAYATEDNIKEDDLWGVYSYQFMQHVIEKKDEAQKAAKAADDAIKAYDDAKTAAENAQKRLEELLKDGNLSAIENAKNRLENAQNALAAAETNRDAALAAQQAAADDYATAMRLAIAVIDDNGNGGGTGTTTTGTGGDGGDSGVSIEDQAVPLAGLVTRAEFVNYLYERMGKPETALSTFTDVPEDHEYALAIGWGQASGLVAGYGDGTFRPDELVIVADVRIILGNYARVFGANAVAAADLKTLTGENDEIVMNSGEVLAEFFGEEYVSAEAEDAETAA